MHNYTFGFSFALQAMPRLFVMTTPPGSEDSCRSVLTPNLRSKDASSRIICLSNLVLLHNRLKRGIITFFTSLLPQLRYYTYILVGFLIEFTLLIIHKLGSRFLDAAQWSCIRRLAKKNQNLMGKSDFVSFCKKFKISFEC